MVAHLTLPIVFGDYFRCLVVGASLLGGWRFIVWCLAALTILVVILKVEVANFCC